jgi:hypothetical protein
MADISNKFLALFVIVAIGISAISTMTLMSKINNIGSDFTGRATTQHGEVQVTIESTVSIILRESVVNFGTGYVNGSCNFPIETNNATLIAAETHTNLNDCWTNRTAQPTSLRLENDGNRNASVTIKGPLPAAFFGGYSGAHPHDLAWSSRDSSGEAGACAQGLVSTFTSFDGTDQNICQRLRFDPSTQDEISIDIMVVIPTDLPPGLYEDSTIEFTAVDAGG